MLHILLLYILYIYIYVLKNGITMDNNFKVGYQWWFKQQKSGVEWYTEPQPKVFFHHQRPSNGASLPCPVGQARQLALVRPWELLVGHLCQMDFYSMLLDSNWIGFRVQWPSWSIGYVSYGQQMLPSKPNHGKMLISLSLTNTWWWKSWICFQPAKNKENKCWWRTLGRHTTTRSKTFMTGQQTWI